MANSEILLRAMAQNYGRGPHEWDHLDQKACQDAADEISQLRVEIVKLRAFAEDVDAISRSGADTISFLVDLNKLAKRARLLLSAGPSRARPATVTTEEV